MVLSKPQMYILDTLHDFRCLRTVHIEMLLQARYSTTGRQVEAMLRQLRVKGKVMIRDDCIMLPGRAADASILRSFDVMLALTGARNIEIFPSAPPFVLLFDLPERNGETARFGIIDANSPRVNAQCANVRLANENTRRFIDTEASADMTVLFMISEEEQSQSIHTSSQHYFALHDGNNNVRFFVNE